MRFLSATLVGEPASSRRSVRPAVSFLGPFLSLALLFVLSCEQTPPPATQGDLIPETYVSGAGLAALPRHGAFLVSESLAAPTGATRAGFLITLRDDTTAVPRIEARGGHGDWHEAEVTWREGRLAVLRAELGHVAYESQWRIAASAEPLLEAVAFSAVVPVARPALGDIDEHEIGASRASLRSELIDIGVNSREAWGARAPNCSSPDNNKTRFAVHHTVTPADSDPGIRLRGIQAYHQDTRGWCDVGYHFLLTLDGQVWEGRELSTLGTHVASHNGGNIGVSFIGCFHTSGCNDWTPFDPPDAMVESAGTLIGTLAPLYDIEVTSATVKGHRDHAGATTSCPGDNLHSRLDDIRETAGSGGPGTPMLRAAYVSQSFPLASVPFEVQAGESVSGNLVVRNTGAQTWVPGRTFLATTEPRDGRSMIAGADWESPNRVASVDREVATGDMYSFDFSIRAPEALGEYPQFFNLVHAGVWFSDPGQGGPPDDQFQVKVTSVANATPDAGTEDAGADAGTDAGGGTDSGAGSDAGTDAGDGDGGMRREPDEGCGCRAGVTGSANGAWFLLALALIARRRETRS